MLDVGLLPLLLEAEFAAFVDSWRSWRKVELTRRLREALLAALKVDMTIVVRDDW
jgi:hypothetical protein